MTNRRAFLGQVIALIGSTPFLAKLVDDKPQFSSKYNYRFDLYEMYNNVWLQGPPIKEIIINDNGWEFIGEILSIKESISISKITIVNKQTGKQIWQSSFSPPFVMMNGDSFTCKQEININSKTRIFLDELLVNKNNWEI